MTASSSAQAGILAPLPRHARFVVLGLRPGAIVERLRDRLASVHLDERTVVGIGQPMVQAGATLRGLRPFPGVAGTGCAFPSTQGAVWLWVSGDDPGELLLRSRHLVQELGDGVDIDEDVAAFQFRGGRDLTGYEDGTENPQGDRAREVAIAKDGSSFVAGQRWVHDLGRFAAMTESARDNTIGRSLETNEELASAPASAHVKRTAQESFEPDAFMLRRSMPWGSTAEHGLYFVAFGATLDPYERVLRRMAGLDDGIVDALLGFTRPVSGGYYWCPPVAGGRLDLEALGSD